LVNRCESVMFLNVEWCSGTDGMSRRGRPYQIWEMDKLMCPPKLLSVGKTPSGWSRCLNQRPQKNLRRCDAALDCDWRWLGARRSLDGDGMEAGFGTRCRGWLAHTSSTHGRTVFLWERIARCTVACANGSSSITLDD
jgi:hypothetical protein